MCCKTLKEKMNQVTSSLRLTFVFYTLISVKPGCIFQSMARHNLICTAFSSLVVPKIMVHLTIKGFWESVKYMLPFHSFCHQDFFHSTHIWTVLKTMFWRKSAQEMLYLNKSRLPSKSPRTPLTYRHFISPPEKHTFFFGCVSLTALPTSPTPLWAVTTSYVSFIIQPKPKQPF